MGKREQEKRASGAEARQTGGCGEQIGSGKARERETPTGKAIGRGQGHWTETVEEVWPEEGTDPCEV